MARRFPEVPTECLDLHLRGCEQAEPEWDSQEVGSSRGRPWITDTNHPEVLQPALLPCLPEATKAKDTVHSGDHILCHICIPCKV